MCKIEIKFPLSEQRQNNISDSVLQDKGSVCYDYRDTVVEGL